MATLVQLKSGDSGVKFLIQKMLFRIGRDADNDISINDDLVSNEHAFIEVETGEDGQIAYFIQDLESTNSTFVNDKAIIRHRLTHDDVIRIGLNSFKFIDNDVGPHDHTMKLHKSWIPGVYYTKDTSK